MTCEKNANNLQAEPLCWVFEDELPASLTIEAYNALFAHSKVDGVRLFPVFGPQAAPQSPTFRDKVAAKALQGLLANPGGPIQACDGSGWTLVNTTVEQVAASAYEWADAMIKARGATS